MVFRSERSSNFSAPASFCISFIRFRAAAIVLGSIRLVSGQSQSHSKQIMDTGALIARPEFLALSERGLQFALGSHVVFAGNHGFCGIDRTFQRKVLQVAGVGLLRQLAEFADRGIGICLVQRKSGLCHAQAGNQNRLRGAATQCRLQRLLDTVYPPILYRRRNAERLLARRATGLSDFHS